MDDGHIEGHNPIWVHTMLTEVVIMFKRVGLQTKIGKTKEIVCNTEFIWGQQGVAVYKRRGTGEGDTSKEQEKTRESYKECGTAMPVSSLHHNMERSHEIVIP